MTGLLVPPRDPTALAAALDALLGDPVRRARLGANARKRAKDYSLDVVIDALELTYTGVLEQATQ